MIHVFSNETLTVSADELGAEICSVKMNGTEYIWQGEPPYWPSHAINLFPVCGRMFEGKYTWRGKTFELMLHGFARTTNFIWDQEKNIFHTESNEQTKKVYPFDFSLDIQYELRDNTLICRDIVKNTGNDPLPFTVGAHPGFRVPLREDESFEDYVIEVNNGRNALRRVISERHLDSGMNEPFTFEKDILKLKHSLFDHDGIFLQNIGDTVSLKDKNGKARVVVKCGQANYWGIWQDPKTEAPFVCIEPWYGMAGADGKIEEFDEKINVVSLEPGKSFTFQYQIIFG